MPSPLTSPRPPLAADGAAETTNGRQIEVDDPASGRIVASVPVLGADQVAALAERARAAQPEWHKLGVQGRAVVFHRAREWLVDNRERVIRTICTETGKTHEDAQLEVSVAAQSFRFWARHAARYLAPERVPALAPLTIGKRCLVRYVPYGLVGVIGPWNYPLVNLFCDAVPALMAGNGVLLKPSEHTPLTALLCAEMMAASGLPADVLQVATGDGTTGAAVVDASDCVMFTGSSRSGRAVMERAGRSLTPVSAELGGKDPMIVLADADLERAARAAAYFGMCNAGQVCISVERVYVEQPVYEPFVERLVDHVRRLRIGPPGPPGSVEVGAITFPRQLEIIEEHVREAVSRGARVRVGGHRLRQDGRFFAPTVLTDVDHTMKCMREETFGPTLPVMSVRDAEEAVRLANDSTYGLQASVWTGDVRRGESIARQIEAGAVCVNDALTNYVVFRAPMGGWKNSGVGSRHGAQGIRKYCRSQTILSARVHLVDRLFMFPYAPWRSRMMGAALRLLYGRPPWAQRRAPAGDRGADG